MTEKTQIREHTWHIHRCTNLYTTLFAKIGSRIKIYFNLSMNFLIVAVKAYLADENETGLGISELAECHWFWKIS